MIELILTTVAATSGTIGLLIAYLNYRARVQAKEQDELPKIQLYGSNGDCHFRLETDQHSIRWKVVRVEVLDSDYRPCPNRYVRTEIGNRQEWRPCEEWRDYCDYPDHDIDDLMSLMFHPDCFRASISFICVTPSRIWWKPWRKKRKRVPYHYEKGAHPPAIPPYLGFLVE